MVRHMDIIVQWIHSLSLLIDLLFFHFMFITLLVSAKLVIIQSSSFQRNLNRIIHDWIQIYRVCSCCRHVFFIAFTRFSIRTTINMRFIRSSTVHMENQLTFKMIFLTNLHLNFESEFDRETILNVNLLFVHTVHQKIAWSIYKKKSEVQSFNVSTYPKRNTLVFIRNLNRITKTKFECMHK